MRSFLYVCSIMAFFLFAGCGSGGGGGGDETTIVVNHIRSASPFDRNPLYPQQWALHCDRSFYNELFFKHDIVGDEDANIHMLPTTQYTGKGVKLGVIDSGLDVSHEDLFGAVAATYNVATKDADVMPTSNDMNHGTEVTGVAAASSNEKGIVGVAPQASVYFVKLPFGQAVSESQIIEAFEKMKEWDVDVVNCSWGSGDMDIGVKDAIVDLTRNGRNGKGVVIVFAAGNEGDRIGNDESSIDEVIAVGSTNIHNERAGYSNYGNTLDLMAPGGEYVGITTTDQMGSAGESSGNYLLYDSRYAFAGTSASAPIVSGVVAQILQANQNLTREEVIQVLETTADKIGDIAYDENGRNDYYGHGKINVANALKLLR
ncbi:S8 family peptidase [Hydrogenimonas sp.]